MFQDNIISLTWITSKCLKTESHQNPDQGQLDHRKDQLSVCEEDGKIIDAIPKSLGARARVKTAADKEIYQIQAHDFQKKVTKILGKMEDLLMNLDEAEKVINRDLGK